MRDDDRIRLRHMIEAAEAARVHPARDSEAAAGGGEVNPLTVAFVNTKAAT